VEGALSVITVTLNYFPGMKPENPDIPVVSKYAYGEDYHDVVRKRLNKLLLYINTNIGAAHGRAFADSAPVLDKVWAAEAGLGWIGKNSCLITPHSGSFFFIGTLVIDLPLTFDKAIHNYCGTCRKCIDACPTGAIVSPYIIDARRCISYLTIENRGEIPAVFSGKMNNRIFGCDICQDVCPWNRKAVQHKVTEFDPLPGLPEMKREEWLTVDEKQYDQLFSKSAIKRTGYEGLRRNLKFTS
jgi:epoxyqueuosine reductase